MNVSARRLRLVLLRPASGKGFPIPESFLGRLRAHFPEALVAEFVGAASSFGEWFGRQDFSEAARIFAQPLYVVGGEEYQRMLHALEENGFEADNIGLPLLSGKSGPEELAGGLFKECCEWLDAGGAVFYVGHGSRLESAERMYGDLGKHLNSLHPNLFAGTLKTDPARVVSHLKNIRGLRLVPLFASAGGSSWRKVAGREEGTLAWRLERMGFKCEVSSLGLLENVVAQDVWLRNIHLGLMRK